MSLTNQCTRAGKSNYELGAISALQHSIDNSFHANLRKTWGSTPTNTNTNTLLATRRTRVSNLIVYPNSQYARCYNTTRSILPGNRSSVFSEENDDGDDGDDYSHHNDDYSCSGSSESGDIAQCQSMSGQGGAP
jgi:hypothetical protein